MSDVPTLGQGPIEPKWSSTNPAMSAVVQNMYAAFPEYVAHNLVSAQDLINFYRYMVSVQSHRAGADRRGSHAHTQEQLDDVVVFDPGSE
jgi:hypothetical protein